MTDKEKLHQILSSLWKNDNSVGKTYYNQALQDVQTAIDLQKEPVSEDLEEAASKYAKSEYDRKNPATLPERCKGCYAPIMYAFKAGAKWQKEHLWKPTNGDDLPEYEREVVVFTKIFPNDAEMMRVAIGHRPNPEGWDGKSLSTGKVTHYTPKLYDKGGWNAPDIAYWLDVELPKELNYEQTKKL